MWTSYNKKFLLFVGIVFVMGLVFGICFYSLLEVGLKESLLETIKVYLNEIGDVKFNFILSHLAVLSVIIVSVWFGLGLILGLVYVFYNGFVLGFILSMFTIVLGFKGFLFGIVYVLITKGVFLFFLLILIVSVIKIGIDVVYSLINKGGVLKSNRNLLFKRSVVCLAFILVNDLVLYFWGDKMINLFNFLVI